MNALLVVTLLVSQVHLEGDVGPEGGDYLVLPFEVPEDTEEFEITHTDNSDDDVLDWGVWGPDGFRGWGGGLTEPIVVGVADSSRGYLPGLITPGTWQLVVGKAKIDGSSAHYTADVTFRTTATLTPRVRASPNPIVLSTERRWYKGDLHVHSNESGDATATIDQILGLAKENGLDFVVLSDHNTVSQQALAATSQTTERDVLLMRGCEITTYGGHGNGIGISQYVDHRIGLGGRTAAQMIRDVAAQNGLFVVNHPTIDIGDACIGCAWTHADTPWDLVGAMELLTGSYGASVALFEPQAVTLWDEKLDEGFRITGVGGSDDHRAGQSTGNLPTEIGRPTTSVLAPALSEAAIMEGIRRGRVVVQLRGPDDPWVELTATGADGTVANIGDTLASHEATLNVRVTGGAGMTLLYLQNGRSIGTASVDGNTFTHSLKVPIPEAGARFRVHLLSDEKDVVITNHVWSVFKPAPASSSGEGGCGGCGNAGMGMVLVGLVGARRRKRID